MRHSIAIVVLSLATAPAVAQWTDDANANLAVHAAAGDQALPEIAATSDGGAWIGWFSSEGGQYVVRCQRLDADGVPQLGPNGVLVSDHPQNSALFGWDMTVDAADHCVLVFSDERDGSDLDIQAYRIAPDGTFVWGPDGITLSDNPDFEPAPRVAAASDGDLVFVWARFGSPTGDLRMQRVSAAGTVELAAGGQVIATEPGGTPGFAAIVPGDAGSVIVSYLRDVQTFASPRHLHAQKFDAAGAALWNGGAPTVVFDAASLPIAYYPPLRSDGAGGAVLAWYRPVGQVFEASVQRLDASGAELFPHDGVLVSTDGTIGHLSPSPSYDPVTGATMVFWQTKNSTQNMWGVNGQKISAAGARQWSATGRNFIALNTIEKTFVRAVPVSDGGAMVFLFDKPTMSVIDARVVGFRVNITGVPQWSPVVLPVSTLLSGKDDLEVAVATNGAALAVWHDERNDGGDIYAQAVQLDGTLGGPACPGDTDGSGAVDVTDLVNVVLDWGTDGSGHGGDVDGSGLVDVADLVQVILGWGPCL